MVEGWAQVVKTYDGTPYEMKVSRTVWSGGKSRDCIKGLPIAIRYDTAI